MPNNIVNATDASFASDVLQSDVPVLVDFWAPWCGPCKAMSPLLDQIVAERDDIRIVKINVDEQSETPMQFKVRGIPTLILFQGGVVKASKVGAQTLASIKSFIDTNS